MENEGLCVNEMFVFLFYDCFCCTDTCQNTMIILNYFMEYINEPAHFSEKCEEKPMEWFFSLGKEYEYHCHNLRDYWRG